MRLEHLRITAFGPFAATVEVDFDDLSEAGLFLLTGPTGAGKTSVLDAVCFALYGEVPGDRQDARHLRSDHAATGAVPEVELRMTLRGRTFTLRRSPSWDRPKRRGTGTTREPARVCVEELVDGDWQPLTVRLDEAGQLVTDLLGMTATQFTQVALLPQGRFQAFLRASSADRHAVLQRLFRTDRFERIEQWLAERRRQLRRDSQTHADAVAALLHRISEVAEEQLPDELADPDIPDGDELTGWATGLLDTAATRHARARDAAAQAEQAHLTAESAREGAVALASTRQRAADARAALDALDRSAVEAEDRRRALAGHRRAAPLRPLLEQATDADREHTQAADRVPALGEAIGLDEQPDGATADRLLDEALREVAAAEAALPLEDRLDEAAARAAAQADRCAQLDAELEKLRADVGGLPAAVRELDEQHQQALTARARLEGLCAEVARVETALQAARRAEELAEAEAAAKLTLQQRVDRVQELREAHLTAREARINAMAGELAGQLAAGCSCPVCGSVDHPAPAHAGPGVGKAEEDAARHAYETAEAERLATSEGLAATSAQLTSARTASEARGPSHWEPLLRQARAAHDDATTLAADLPRLGTALADARQRLDEATERLDTARDEHAAALAARAAADRAHEELAAQVSTARAGFDDVEQRLAAARDRHERVCALKAALDAAQRARLRRDRSHRDLATAAAAAGFDPADPTAPTDPTYQKAPTDPTDVASAVTAALLDDRVADQAAEFLREREERAVTARAVLAEPEVREALAVEPPDIDRLTARLDAALAARQSAEEGRVRAERTHTRLGALADELGQALRDWAPVREARRVAAGVSALAEGTGSDNTLKMRLSAYVLSERLRQVVAAANTRLARMTDCRYTLEHTDERTVGAKRGGLGLWVRDDWTGARRDPATLSGGETFVVSLALALGLADTVTHEAGGTEIDTLFIDEGFGSLDTDTLDDVMDTLDSLREGGRVVGVVSHVAELRDRIPTRLEVHKARHGSTVRALGAA